MWQHQVGDPPRRLYPMSMVPSTMRVRQTFD
jgi:hypothetical protein